MNFRPKDFIETKEGFLFAVVDSVVEENRVLGTFRYIRDHLGVLRKLDSEEAKDLLKAHAPQYNFYSNRLNVTLPGINEKEITRHFSPTRRLTEILEDHTNHGHFLNVREWLKIMTEAGLDLSKVGITGSLLLGEGGPCSDLDFVIYQRKEFLKAREIIKEGIKKHHFTALNQRDWFEAFERRGCALSFESYLWHEQRKFNKGMIHGTKFDITLYQEEGSEEQIISEKTGPVTIFAEVIDATRSYDYPAIYRLNHAEVSEAQSFTQTYVGQAQPGERVAICGTLERLKNGTVRIVVGSSREATGEYIRVLGHTEK